MNRSEDSEAFLTLLKETVDGLGQLITGHVNLARLEFLAELKSLGRQFAVVTIAVIFILLGYTFGCLGLAVVMSRWLGFGGALFLLGALHLVGGVTALVFIVRKRKLTHLMQESKMEATKSVSTLTANVLNGSAADATVNTSGEARIVNTPN